MSPRSAEAVCNRLSLDPRAVRSFADSLRAASSVAKPPRVGSSAQHARRGPSIPLPSWAHLRSASAPALTPRRARRVASASTPAGFSTTAKLSISPRWFDRSVAKRMTNAITTPNDQPHPMFDHQLRPSTSNEAADFLSIRQLSEHSASAFRRIHRRQSLLAHDISRGRSMTQSPRRPTSARTEHPPASPTPRELRRRLSDAGKGHAVSTASISTPRPKPPVRLPTPRPSQRPPTPRPQEFSTAEPSSSFSVPWVPSCALVDEEEEENHDELLTSRSTRVLQSNDQLQPHDPIPFTSAAAAARGVHTIATILPWTSPAARFERQRLEGWGERLTMDWCEPPPRVVEASRPLKAASGPPLSFRQMERLSSTPAALRGAPTGGGSTWAGPRRAPSDWIRPPGHHSEPSQAFTNGARHGLNGRPHLLASAPKRRVFGPFKPSKIGLGKSAPFRPNWTRATI